MDTLDDVKALARQKGFAMLVVGAGKTFELIDRHFGLPVLNPNTLTVEFSLEEAAAYLALLHDRRIEPGKDRYW